MRDVVMEFIGLKWNARPWVSITLAVGWALLALLEYRRRGYGFSFVMYIAMLAVRVGMAIGH